jgi:hypothetical protein
MPYYRGSQICDTMTPYLIHKFTRPHPPPPPKMSWSAKSAVLHIVAGPCQTVRGHQKPKYLYNLSTPTVNYKIFLSLTHSWS